MSDIRNSLYWVWLSGLYTLNLREKIDILNRFKRPDKIWNADKIELATLPWMTSEKLCEILDQTKRNNSKYYLEIIEKEKINIISIQDQGYPVLLKNIYDPPVVLYVKGTLCEEQVGISIVGSRKASRYGLEVAEKIAFELSQKGIVVVSGMARGVDTAAHKGALKCCGGTIAVLGCGSDVVYPPENKRLKEEIEQIGAVVTEYLPGVPPQAFNFPVRNRIISGLSLGVVIVEAKEKSGSLITANLALNQNRDVFAIPGNINLMNSRGTNKLLKEGAKLVLSVDDILEEYIHLNLYSQSVKKEKFEESRESEEHKENKESEVNKESQQNQQNRESIENQVGRVNQFSNTSQKSLRIKHLHFSELGENEHKILSILGLEDSNIDSLSERSGIRASELNFVMLNLEIKGLVKQLPGNRYMLCM